MEEARAEVLRESSCGERMRQRDFGVALLTVGVVAVGWLLWKAAGVDLEVRSGAGGRHIGHVVVGFVVLVGERRVHHHGVA